MCKLFFWLLKNVHLVEREKKGDLIILNSNLQALEDFLWQSSDLLGRLEEMREDLNANDFADDVNSAKTAVELHMELRRKIHKIPVENMDSLGQRLLHRLSTQNDGSKDSLMTSMAFNPDLQATIPQIMHLLDQMHSGQQHLLHLWQIKKTKLEQCLQLRVFEQDCEKVVITAEHITCIL